MVNNDIKLGASIYSMTSNFVKYGQSLESCLQEIADMGFKGVEMVAAQTVPEYPHPTDKWLYEFRDLLEKYGLTPVCYSAYIDYGMRTERDMTREEIIQSTQNDMIYAKKVGFQMVRTQHSISPEIFEAMVPFCEELDMMLTIEMHHPHHPGVPVWEKYIELMHKYRHLGAVPDFGIFQRRPHRLLINRLLQAGFRPDKLEEMLKNFEEKVPAEESARALGLTEQETGFTKSIYGMFNPTPISALETLVPVSPYMHGKFYYLENGELDPCVPYHEILPKCKELGFKGFIAAEYEGHHFDMTVDIKQQLAYYADIFHKYIS